MNNTSTHRQTDPQSTLCERFSWLSNVKSMEKNMKEEEEEGEKEKGEKSIWKPVFLPKATVGEKGTPNSWYSNYITNLEIFKPEKPNSKKTPQKISKIKRSSNIHTKV